MIVTAAWQPAASLFHDVGIVHAAVPSPRSILGQFAVSWLLNIAGPGELVEPPRPQILRISFLSGQTLTQHGEGDELIGVLWQRQDAEGFPTADW